VVASPGSATEVAAHDIVVVGASAGGVEALRRMMARVAPVFDATMFVVLHLPANAHSALPQILERAGPLPVRQAVDGAVPVRGMVYVAPPDVHLLLHQDRIALLHGPTENGHRPAIDPLFRSAASAYGPRVIGMILSGALDDGTAGLLAVSRSGGLTMVQAPHEALYPSMPQSALDAVPVDVVGSAEELGERLAELVHHPAPWTDPGSDSGRGDFTERALEGGGALEMRGRPSRFTCPDCGGSLWESVDEGRAKFRCRVGHSWTAAGLLDQQAVTLEQALWTGLRALAERADLARKMREQAEASRRTHAVGLFDRQLKELEEKADVIRDVLQRPDGLLARPPMLHTTPVGDRDTKGDGGSTDRRSIES
jgi:two-component system, chemotaxis family, protein-glutamate methylesterase/glutaminase